MTLEPENHMKHILITGASGALGSALVPLFASDSGTRVTLLMRADSPEHLADRFSKLLNYLRTIGLDSISENRVNVVRGDISSGDLGLNPDIASDLVRSITHVVHSAGNVKLNQSMDQARQTAVGSARAIVDFARRCQTSGRFQKLDFVSTVGVAGRRPGLIPEVRISTERADEDFHNTYEAAKWEAEQYLWGQIDDGLPATIHRPSMIVGDSASGSIIHYQVFYFLTDFLLGRRTWGIVPRTGDVALDIIPVDYVANAIHAAAVENLGTGQVWHLCSGQDLSWPLEKLISEIRDLLAKQGQPVPRSRSVSLVNFRRLLRFGSRMAPAGSRRFLSGLPFLLDYLDEDQQFDNSRTVETLQSRGITIPPVESYLETVMTPYWQWNANRKR